MRKKSSHTMSVIIPVGNRSPYLPDVLRAINSQSYRPQELIIVNDSVGDGSLDCLNVLDMEYKVVSTSREKERYGVSAARNIGAENSNYDILVFLDSDVLLPDTYLAQLHNKFCSFHRNREEIDGILGISDEDCCFRDFFSNYKNLWMRYTYRRLTGFVGTLNTSCFAITRQAFFESGGFDEFRRRDVEDAVYGDKLFKKGYRIIIDKELEYIHKKKYNLLSVLRVDIFRSRKLTEYTVPLLLKREKNPKSSIPKSYFFSIPLFYSALAFALLAVLISLNQYLIFTSLLLILLSSGLSMDFIAFVKKCKGLGFAIKAFFYQLAVLAASGIGIAAGLFRIIASGNSGKKSKRTKK